MPPTAAQCDSHPWLVVTPNSVHLRDTKTQHHVTIILVTCDTPRAQVSGDMLAGCSSAVTLGVTALQTHQV